MAESPTIGIGVLGQGFMGRAHAHAFHTLSHMVWPPPLRPRLQAVAGRDAAALDETARRFGYATTATDWRAIVEDPAVELFDNAGPNALHAAPTLAALAAGKHVICEKPLGLDADEAHELWQRAAGAGVKHLCGFNYRFVPAVRLAHELIASGRLGTVRHLRASYLQDWLIAGEPATGWRMEKAQAGSGVLGDLGSHIVDLTRYLVGEVEAVSGTLSAYDGGEVDQAFAATVELANGAVGTLEASRVAFGSKNALRIEVNGTEGTLAFDLERLNELQLSAGRDDSQGLSRILVTEHTHPYLAPWWPPGHVLGWEHTFVHELHHLLAAIAGDTEIAPHGATFEDGYRAAEVCDAIARSSSSGRREGVRRLDADRHLEGAAR